MKTIQVTIDAELLHEIDNDDACKGKSRSEFLRQAARHYLKHQRLKSISERYRAGYARGLAKDDGPAVWEDEQAWPPE